MALAGLNRIHVFSSRTKLLWTPNQDFSALFQYEYSRDDGDTPPIVNESADDSVFAAWGYTASKRPYGFGLCQVHGIMNRLGGNLFLRSGSASAVFIAHGARTGTFLRNGLAPFAGTQISLTLTSEK